MQKKKKKNIKGEISQKVFKRGVSFLYATHGHDLFYMPVKYHQNIPNGFYVIKRTRNGGPSCSKLTTSLVNVSFKFQVKI